MKIFDKTKSFAPDHFHFDMTKKNIFLGAKLFKTIKMVPAVEKFMIRTKIVCVTAA